MEVVSEGDYCIYNLFIIYITLFIIGITLLMIGILIYTYISIIYIDIIHSNQLITAIIVYEKSERRMPQESKSRDLLEASVKYIKPREMVVTRFPRYTLCQL